MQHKDQFIPSPGTDVTRRWLMPVVLLLLCACGNKDEQTSREAVVQADTLQIPIVEGLFGKGLQIFNFDANKDDGGASARRAVPKDEQDCNEKDFGAFIGRRQFTSYIAIKFPHFDIIVDSLKDVLDSSLTCAVTNDTVRGVIVHFGLNSSYDLDLAFELVCLKYDPDRQGFQYAANGTYFILRNGDLVPSTSKLKDWYAATGNGGRYGKDVGIKRNNAPGAIYEAFQQGRDVISIAFPYEPELLRVINDNGLLGQDTMRLMPTASPGAWLRTASGPDTYLKYDYGQGITWLPKKWNVTLDNIDHTGSGTPFKNKGADLGSPCPPNCPVAKFIVYGTPKRPSCF